MLLMMLAAWNNRVSNLHTTEVVGSDENLLRGVTSPATSQPRTAFLLVGLMRHWDEGDFIDLFLNKMVKPNSADVFIHAPEVPLGLVVALNQCLKGYEEEDLQDETLQQFWHLEKAWSAMKKHESETKQKYDIVVRTRTEIAPVGNSYLSLLGWEQKGRIHMMTDMLFWGQREDMEKVVRFHKDFTKYYMVDYREPMSRPLHLKAFLESMKRDPQIAANTTAASEALYNKFSSLAYPDMGRISILENVQAAIDAGVDLCIDDKFCQKRCGSHYPKNSPRSCVAAGEFQRDQIRSERDILDWVLAQDLVICDVGASMRTVRFHTWEVERELARDCDGA